MRLYLTLLLLLCSSSISATTVDVVFIKGDAAGVSILDSSISVNSTSLDDTNIDSNEYYKLGRNPDGSARGNIFGNASYQTSMPKQTAIHIARLETSKRLVEISYQFKLADQFILQYTVSGKQQILLRGDQNIISLGIDKSDGFAKVAVNNFADIDISGMSDDKAPMPLNMMTVVKELGNTARMNGDFAESTYWLSYLQELSNGTFIGDHQPTYDALTSLIEARNFEAARDFALFKQTQRKITADLLLGQINESTLGNASAKAPALLRLIRGLVDVGLYASAIEIFDIYQFAIVNSQNKDIDSESRLPNNSLGDYISEIAFAHIMQDQPNEVVKLVNNTSLPINVRVAGLLNVVEHTELSDGSRFILINSLNNLMQIYLDEKIVSPSIKDELQYRYLSLFIPSSREFYENSANISMNNSAALSQIKTQSVIRAIEAESNNFLFPKTQFALASIKIAGMDVVGDSSVGNNTILKLANVSLLLSQPRLPTYLEASTLHFRANLRVATSQFDKIEEDSIESVRLLSTLLDELRALRDDIQNVNLNSKVSSVISPNSRMQSFNGVPEVSKTNSSYKDHKTLWDSGLLDPFYHARILDILSRSEMVVRNQRSIFYDLEASLAGADFIADKRSVGNGLTLYTNKRFVYKNTASDENHSDKNSNKIVKNKTKSIFKSAVFFNQLKDYTGRDNNLRQNIVAYLNSVENDLVNQISDIRLMVLMASENSRIANLGGDL